MKTRSFVVAAAFALCFGLALTALAPVVDAQQVVRRETSGGLDTETYSVTDQAVASF